MVFEMTMNALDVLCEKMEEKAKKECYWEDWYPTEAEVQNVIDCLTRKNDRRLCDFMLFLSEHPNAVTKENGKIISKPAKKLVDKWCRENIHIIDSDDDTVSA